MLKRWRDHCACKSGRPTWRSTASKVPLLNKLTNSGSPLARYSKLPRREKKSCGPRITRCGASSATVASTPDKDTGASASGGAAVEGLAAGASRLCKVAVPSGLISTRRFTSSGLSCVPGCRVGKTRPSTTKPKDPSRACTLACKTCPSFNPMACTVGASTRATDGADSGAARSGKAGKGTMGGA